MLDAGVIERLCAEVEIVVTLEETSALTLTEIANVADVAGIEELTVICADEDDGDILALDELLTVDAPLTGPADVEAYPAAL